jgi:hypothetical protein
MAVAVITKEELLRPLGWKMPLQSVSPERGKRSRTFCIEVNAVSLPVLGAEGVGVRTPQSQA